MPINLNELVKFASAISEIDSIQAEIHQIAAVLAIIESARYSLIANGPLSAAAYRADLALSKPKPGTDSDRGNFRKGTMSLICPCLCYET